MSHLRFSGGIEKKFFFRDQEFKLMICKLEKKCWNVLKLSPKLKIVLFIGNR